MYKRFPWVGLRSCKGGGGGMKHLLLSPLSFLLLLLSQESFVSFAGAFRSHPLLTPLVQPLFFPICLF